MISLMEKVNALNNGKIEKKSKKLGDKDYSEIKQWPLQIDLVPEKAPFYNQQDFLIASDCTAFAYGNFHRDLMKNHITLIGCQKLKSESYFPKLIKIFTENDIKSITIVRMENPCCGNMENVVLQALKESGKNIPLKIKIVTIDGKLLDK